MRFTLKILVVLLLVVSCRTEEGIISSSSSQVTYPDAEVGEVKGMFVLNEGNMGSNKASIDYFDYAKGTYSKNIYAERNPSVVYELGDVGNDIQIYGDRIYAVINCSNLVEVMSLSSAEHIGAVSVPACRYIAFHDNYAYVSSYAGTVLGDGYRLGYVAKIDLSTLEVVAKCEVGYQPEELAVAGDKLYVANSGGYNVPDYDNRLSVIDLDTFTLKEHIEVGINLHSLERDQYGYLWITSQGDHGSIPSKTYILNTSNDEVVKVLDLPNSSMARCGDTLYVIGNSSNNDSVVYYTVDVENQEIISGSFITDGTASSIVTPYSVAVNPETKEIFVCDAKDYITPGKLYCFSAAGVLKWSVITGDIPAHIAFSTSTLQEVGGEKPTPDGSKSAYITKVLEYMPAPGQFVNKLPEYEAGDNQDVMNEKALESIGRNNKGTISLGGYGGYVVVGFDHTIENVEGKCDFRIVGNATPTSSEPGIIMVAYDTNQNGVPDEEEWREIAGSSHVDHTQEGFYNDAVEAGNDTSFYFRDFEITYTKPLSEPTSAEFATYIPWSDNKGNSGYIVKNGYNKQSYFPEWISSEEINFSGSRLPQNAIDTSGSGANYVLYSFGYGYADNLPNSNDGTAIDISWAVDGGGERVQLKGVDFVKIYTGVNATSGWIGECSTEISGVEDLHILGIEIASQY